MTKLDNLEEKCQKTKLESQETTSKEKKQVSKESQCIQVGWRIWKMSSRLNFRSQEERVF